MQDCEELQMKIISKTHKMIKMADFVVVVCLQENCPFVKMFLNEVGVNSQVNFACANDNILTWRY